MRGMLAGHAINVYLSGNVALVQGVVRTAADRVVLGNVLGLEPDVRGSTTGWSCRGTAAARRELRPATARTSSATTPARRPRTVRDRGSTRCGSTGRGPT